MSTVALEHVSKDYPDGTRAVDDVDLGIADGELFVLLGPSGCGKSTLLRMIAGLETVGSGVVRIDGAPVNDLRPSEREVAMIHQAPVVYPSMTVEQNLAFPLRMSRVARSQTTARVRQVALALGLLDVLDRAPAQLSGGQQQRVAMGRAIIRAPRLLLMDEPMSNLDAALRTDLRGQLVRLQRALGTTTIHVTHDQVEAMAMADRLAVLRDGRVVQCDRPLRLYHDPLDVFVAAFVGVPPIGLVTARVVGVGAGVGLRVGDGLVTLGSAALRRFPGLADQTGRKVVLGLRAEDLAIDPDGELLGSPVHAESHGGAQVVRVSVGADTLHPTEHGPEPDRQRIGLPVVVGPGLRLEPYRPVRLRVDDRHLHLFDAGSGASLALQAR